MQAVNRSRSYSDIVKLLAERSANLLDGPDLSDDQSLWLRSLEKTYGVCIEMHTTLGPDNRPSAIDGVISGEDHLPPGFQWAFRIDRHETRCCLRALD
ncbi:MAG: hypothetical protein R3A79_31570 [Nannocystaceae bacterium]